MRGIQPSDLKACGQLCLDCLRTCSETISSCLSKGGEHANAHHITQLLDCILICETTANFLNRGSTISLKMCELCADVCDKCAESCEGWDDSEMDRCAEECRSCADCCRSIIG